MKLSRLACCIVPALALLTWAMTPSAAQAAAAGAGAQKLAEIVKKHHHKHHHHKKGLAGKKLGEKGKKVAFKAGKGKAAAAGQHVGNLKKHHHHHHHKGMGKGMKAIEHLIKDIKEIEKEMGKKKRHHHRKMAAGKGKGAAGQQVGQKKGKGKKGKGKFDASLMKLLVKLEDEMEGHKHPGHRMGEKKPQAFAKKGNGGLTPTLLKVAGNDKDKGKSTHHVGAMIGKHKMHMPGFAR